MSDAARARRVEWLLAITQLPTAAGREGRVIEWIRAWVAGRPELVLREDPAGNLVVEPKKPWGGARGGAKGGAKGKGRVGPGTIYITAHLDHPAFVVERMVGPGTAELSFRGGVMDAYIENARVVVHTTSGERVPAVLAGVVSTAGSSGGVFTTYLAELEGDDADELVRVGDVATWDLPKAEIVDGIVHTAACDDLAALAAAIAAMDELVDCARRGETVEDVRLLFTRAEEIGFVGAIAACKHGTMGKGARVIALENSRSFADSPIGGGPIVRVGDRMSVFSPRLTAACAKRAEELSGRASGPTASQRESDLKGWKWQRKLMAGGACEATVFCAYGYDATCLCLPLGNYHNMADLQAVQDGTYDAKAKGPPRVAREFIAESDYHGLVDLLVGIGTKLPAEDPALGRIEMLYRTRGFVLDEGRAPAKPARAKKAGAARAARPARKPAKKPASAGRRAGHAKRGR
jgi:putative aminopeptidase FrvX